MIRHIVFFTARNREDLEAIQDGLMMLKNIPHARHFEVGRNLRADTITEAEVDLVVYVEFDTKAELEAYKAHPIYQQAIARVRPLRESRIAADVEAAPSG